MSDKEKNKSVEDADITIKEAANKLDISDATVKKYLKDFDLPFGKGPVNKALIAIEAFKALSEIVKLRANGLSIQEIKELKTEEPSKNIAEELEEIPVIEVEKLKELTPEALDVNSEIALAISDSALLGELSASESSSLVDASEDADDTDADAPEDEDAVVEGQIGEDGEPTQRKKRGFNYRYVERQISSDSKRVSSIRIRLKNPNLSVQDRMFFEEALERRILFLNGWKHILKWIAK